MVDPVRVVHAWLLLNAAFGLHFYEEATTGFLPIYNQTVAAIRARVPGLPLPAFSRRQWFTSIGAGVGLLLAITPGLFCARHWANSVACIVSGVMIGNALLHIAGSIRGRTFQSVRFARPMPGFYSSPLLLAASLELLATLH